MLFKKVFLSVKNVTLFSVKRQGLGAFALFLQLYC